MQLTSRRTNTPSHNETTASGRHFTDVQETGGWHTGFRPLHVGLLLSTYLLLTCYAGAQNVSLQWDANPEPSIDHYEIYCRPLAGGPFSRVNDFPIAHIGAPSTISFTDTSNAAACGGLPAQYVITAIDAEGEESGFSNAVSIATTTTTTTTTSSTTTTTTSSTTTTTTSTTTTTTSSTTTTLSQENGNLEWTFSTGQSVDSSALLGADGTVYFGSGDSYLYAVN